MAERYQTVQELQSAYLDAMQFLGDSAVPDIDSESDEGD